MNRPFRVVIVALILGLAGLAGAESKTFVHFLVVPVEARDGLNFHEELASLKLKLAQLAGGYTELGRTNGGALRADGSLDTEENVSFLVAAPTNITAELEAYIPQRFKTAKPFILVWEGVVNF